MKRFLFVIFYSLAFLFTSQASAQMGPDAASAMANLYSSEGDVTKAQYDIFWKETGVENRAEKKKIIDFMRSNFLFVQSYQKEVWVCAEIFWIARGVAKCDKLEQELGALKIKLKEIGQEDSLVKLTESSDLIINAAAVHGTVSVEGKEIQMSLQMIRDTLSNLEKIYSKFEQILKMDY